MVPEHKSAQLRFRALLTEGGEAQVFFYREGFGWLGENLG
jgi:hypothetical protein